MAAAKTHPWTPPGGSYDPRTGNFYDSGGKLLGNASDNYAGGTPPWIHDESGGAAVLDEGEGAGNGTPPQEGMVWDAASGKWIWPKGGAGSGTGGGTSGGGGILGPVDVSNPGANLPNAPLLYAGMPNITPPGGATEYDDPRYTSVAGMVGDTSVHTREVKDDELTSYQMDQLLRSESAYMQQARTQGAALGGGLGGSMGARSAQGAAIAAAAPIAESDAMAYRDAATQNLDALNNFAIANIQRATALQTTQMNNRTQLQMTSMNNQMQWAVSQLQAATQINVANLDSQTRMRITEMNGKIQAALADLNYRYNRNLSYQEHLNNIDRDSYQHGYNLEEIALGGEYELAASEMAYAQQRELNYITSYQQAYAATLAQIENLNGIEMDNTARQNAINQIWDGYYAQVDLLNALYGYTNEDSPIETENSGRQPGDGYA